MDKIERSMTELTATASSAARHVEKAQRAVRKCGEVMTALDKIEDLESPLAEKFEEKFREYAADQVTAVQLAAGDTKVAQTKRVLTNKTITEFKAYVAKKASKLYFWKSAKSVPASKVFLTMTETNLAAIERKLDKMQDDLADLQKLLYAYQ